MSQGQKLQTDQQSDQMLKYLACRAAVKQGDQLTEKAAKDLVQKLLKTENNLYCPHGRPTMIEYSLFSLNKQFKRL